MYTPDNLRYERIDYKYCGKSGLQLPLISLGLWQNFGKVNSYENSKKMLFHAFDSGITHFDLANNYGPPFGSAELTFNKVMKDGLGKYRDELIISSKAGYDMWDGPYGIGGSRKYLIASLDQSLVRMGLEYVDIFYHHCPDPNTPLEESMGALHSIVQSGKALYVGVSSYSPERTAEAYSILEDMGTRLFIHQPKYSMLERNIEDGLLETLADHGIGCIPFSPLAQGLLTDRYFSGIPAGSRAERAGSLKPEVITDELLEKLRQLNELAKSRGQKLAELAISWILRKREVTSVLIGASNISQIDDAVRASKAPMLTNDEEVLINNILK